MSAQMDQARANAEARRLRAKARSHKRQEKLERKAARDAMQEFNDFVRRCRAAGLIVIVENPTEPRRQSDSKSAGS